jgi:glycosyltransferase involved in cell wall biosynthesis
MHNPKISIIGVKGIPKNFSGTSGIETYVENHAQKLIKTGFQVSCYVRRWSTGNYKSDSYLGIKRIIIPSINTKLLDAITHSFLASIHASLGDSSIIWYHGIGPAFFSFIPKLFHKKVYTTIHSLDWRRKKWGVFAQLFLYICEKLTISNSTQIFVVSTQLKNYYSNKFKIIPTIDKYIIPKHRSVKPNIIRLKHNLKPNSYILFMGRFVPEKRVEWLIKTADEIRFKIVLSGGSSHTSDYSKNLYKQAANRNIIFTDYVFGQEKNELISNCKIFVLPSMLEGYPIVISEALSYNRHCLVGDFLKSEYSAKNKLIHYFQTNNYSDFLDKVKKLI